MKRYFFALTAAMSLMGLSSAQADYSYTTGYDCCPSYDTCCNRFDGFYLGGNVGWALQDRTWVDRDNWADNFSQDFAIGSIVSREDGATVGLQMGYNKQCGCTLVGIEIDGNWADLKNTKHASPLPNVGPQFRLKENMQWFGTIRGRAGIVCDNMLLYTTLGAVVADIKHAWKMVDGATVESFKSEGARWGLAVGAGAEWAFCDMFTLKAEALYFDFPEHTKTVFSTAATDQNVHFDLIDSAWIARVGINVKLCDLFSCCGCSY